MNNSKLGLLTPEQATKQVQKSIDRRNNQEKRYRFYGRLAIAIALIFLVTLFVTIISKGAPGFFQYYVTLDVELDRERLDPKGDLSTGSLYSGDARGVVREALFAVVNPEGRSGRRAAGKMVSSGSEERIRKFVQKNPELFGTIQPIRFALDDDIDSFMRGFIKRETPEADRRINDNVIGYVDLLNAQGRISYNFSDYLIFGSASRDAEMAGIKGAFIGSIMTLAVCLVLSFPIGVATAVYLEEIAKKNRITEFIEININNLAAVPSVVFGILGLAIFIGVFGMPRSIPLIGGVVLALMTLPTIIISSRAAIRAVPPSVRDAAYGVGASRIQTIFHHVIPLAMPGMLTGTIIGMAQALGETAPLLMIGMVAFIVDVPGSVMDPGTVLPVQIFMWADFAERMFIQKTSAAIIVLLVFLVGMNAFAIILRKRLERRW
ncbi:MAG: phosphate ABC transporter permease PstA [Candidatus Puniceispirillum sp.]|jgi:phosphate transport system permease protein|uniref:phosphate ABC transporter permease PstA n=1 Tax=uncultured Candidatus Puniceispirillum sp. TaxID=1985115 RepID=UPI002A746CA2|nr:phosphate ABC transporter permease PstA [Candidatus Puniceispirillum sp.]MBT6565691.1 phosphate ABC transporter permease PstA [Candidatus Puniceispirillum sp.]